MTEPLHQTFVFDTTNAALWAEEVAREALLPVEVVPAPADSRAGCDLALITLPERAARLAEVLDAAGVPFRIWPADTPAAPQ
ncbi:MAG: DUF3343 domain-containing protein [Longimicrobiales bacterium]